MAASEIPPEILAGIKETLGCIAIGGIIGTAFVFSTVNMQPPLRLKLHT